MHQPVKGGQEQHFANGCFEPAPDQLQHFDQSNSQSCPAFGHPRG
jgi:hypothetical protein